jgi:hypothetical protein
LFLRITKINTQWICSFAWVSDTKRRTLSVSENRVLGRIFGRKREEVAGGWRRLHNEELHNLYASPHILKVIKSRRMKWVGHIARMEEMKNAYTILVGEPEGKKPLRRPRRRWEDNIRTDLKEIGWEGVDWIHLAQDRNQRRDLMNTVMKLRVP